MNDEIFVAGSASEKRITILNLRQLSKKHAQFLRHFSEKSD
jgi:hypothetical protein